jgi:hypothetical protein
MTIFEVVPFFVTMFVCVAFLSALDKTHANDNWAALLLIIAPVTFVLCWKLWFVLLAAAFGKLPKRKEKDDHSN